MLALRVALFALRDARVEGSMHIGARHVGAMDALDPREQVALLKEELAKKEALIELAAPAQLQDLLAAIEQSGGRPAPPTRRLSYVPRHPLADGRRQQSGGGAGGGGRGRRRAGAAAADEIVGAMRSPDEVQRGEAIDLLSELVNPAYGEDGRACGRRARCRGIALLAWMLTDPSLRVQQQTLLILEPVLELFDPASEETKALPMECAARPPRNASAQTPLTPTSPPFRCVSVPSSVVFPTTRRC